jgi:hypothetical protein
VPSGSWASRARSARCPASSASTTWNPRCCLGAAPPARQRSSSRPPHAAGTPRRAAGKRRGGTSVCTAGLRVSSHHCRKVVGCRSRAAACGRRPGPGRCPWRSSCPASPGPSPRPLQGAVRRATVAHTGRHGQMFLTSRAPKATGPVASPPRQRPW